MDFSTTFLDIIHQIEDYKLESNPREMKVKEALMASFDIDPHQPIADFIDRPFNFKYFAGELAWYLKRDKNIDFINHFSKFWNNITNEGTNEVNSNYGSLVLNNEQIGWVVNSLIKDKDSRQAIMFFNNPEFQVEGNKDFVCTLYANFFIRNNTLFMKVQMRSNDIFFGLTFDAPFFSFLHQSIYKILLKTYPDLKLGYYFHHVDNIHFYERHFNLVEQIKNNGAGNQYTMILDKSFIDLDSDGNVFLTDTAIEFLRRIDNAVKNEKTNPEFEADYKLILRDYFAI